MYRSFTISIPSIARYLGVITTYQPHNSTHQDRLIGIRHEPLSYVLLGTYVIGSTPPASLPSAVNTLALYFHKAMLPGNGLVEVA